MSAQRSIAGVLLIFLGVFLVFIALAIFLLGSGAKGFGIIIIGPVPILVSGGVEAVLILTAISILVIVIIAIFILTILRRYASQ